MLSKVSVGEVLMHYFKTCHQFLGVFAPRFSPGLCPYTRWKTCVHQTP